MTAEVKQGILPCCYGKEYYKYNYVDVCKGCGFNYECYKIYKENHKAEENIPRPKIEPTTEV